MTTQSDQRDYFRIDENVILDYTPVEKQQAREDSASSFFPEQAHLKVFADFKKLGRELHSLLANLDPSVSQVIKLQDKRQDLMANHLFSEHNKKQTNPVNLSEGGLSFVAKKSAYKGSHLALSLTFLEGGFTLFCFAEVLRCETHKNGHQLACRFLRLADTDKTLLARHILASQRKTSHP